MTPAAATVVSNSFLAGGDDIEITLLGIFRKFLKTDESNWSASTTMAEVQIDSLDLVELIFEIEDQFGVEISFNANAKSADETTFGDVVDLIRSALAAKARKA